MLENADIGKVEIGVSEMFCSLFDRQERAEAEERAKGECVADKRFVTRSSSVTDRAGRR